MKRKIFLNFVLLFSLISSAAFGQKSEERTLDAFHKIATYDGISVQLVSSDTYMVRVSGPHTEKLKTDVSSGTLKIKIAFGSSFKGDENHVVIYFKGNLDEIKATEGSHITSNDVISGENIEVRAMEGAEIELNLRVKNIYGRSASGALVNFIGESENIELEINTGGEIDARALHCKKAKVQVKAGGKAEVMPEDELKASVSMGGHIFYYGTPKLIEETISLGGVIQAKK